MRKVIYGSIALVVVGAAGAYLLVDHASRYPDSGVARWITTVAEVGTHVNPFTTVLGQAAPGLSGAPIACTPQPGRTACPAPVNKFPKPFQAAQAAPIEEPMEVIRVEPAPEENVAQAADQTDEAGPEPCEGPDAVADNAAQETNEPDRAGTAEESEPADRGEDVEWDDVRMPYADEDETPASSADQDCGWLWKILDELTQPEPAGWSQQVQVESVLPSTTEEQDEPCEALPAPATSETPANNPGEESQAEPPHYSDCHHEEGCPAMGCPYPHGACLPPITGPSTDDQPMSRPVKKIKKFRIKKPTTDQPADSAPVDGAAGDVSSPTNVDTMEYRPTDGDEDAYRDLRF
jgi:hypothetical protein